jgi:hypothetical protein
LIGVGAGCGGTTEPAGDGGADGPPPAIACPWGSFPTLTLPTSDTKAVLKGASRNASTTCTRQKGTGGPETVFVLPIKARTTVELEVVSDLDAVVAIRSACDDALTEIACNDSPNGGSNDPGTGGTTGGSGASPEPPFFADAGVSQPPPGGHAGTLRTTLNPGTYYVLVDEAAPFGVGGPITLKLRSSAPAANAACSGAKVLTDGVSFTDEELDVALDKPMSCTGGEAHPALYYSARIPSGQRLTVRANRTGGDRDWAPVMSLIPGCGKGVCLATDRTTGQGDQLLRYVNNNPTAEDVILAVSASTVVNGATFRLDVSLGDPVLNGTCAAARPVSDGEVLRNQDLTEGEVTSQGNCLPPGSQALYYAVKLLPQQSFTAMATTRTQSNFPEKFFPLFLVMHTSCNQMDCRQVMQGERLDFVNNLPVTQNLILEIASQPGLPPPVFDLTIQAPLPAGQISVLPTTGLVTSESGGTASFEISLGSPPSAPVTIPVESSAPGEGTVSPAMVTFTPDSWDKPQKVTVTGADDMQRDGNRTYTILVKAAKSDDPRYDGLDAEDVSVVNRDNEASITFSGNWPLTTSESASTVTFTAVLNKKPTADVTVPLSTSDPGEGVVAPSSLTFTTSNWDTPQLVTVTGVDDMEQDGAQPYKVVIGVVASADPAYSGLDPEDLEALNADNEFIFKAPRPVNGGLPCFDSGSGRIGADEAGTLYVVMTCIDGSGGGGGGAPDGGATGTGGSAGGGSGPRGAADAGAARPVPPPVMGGPGAFIAVSRDGAETFTTPQNLSLPSLNDAQVVGGPAGVAYVTGSSPQGTYFVRTQDSGRSWSKPLLLTAEPAIGPLHIEAAGQRLIITSFGSNGPVLWHSEDGGRAFKQTKLEEVGMVMASAVEGSGTVRLFGQDSGSRLWTSTDGGATFSKSALMLDSMLFFDAAKIGPTLFFGTSKEVRLQVLPLDGNGMPTTLSGLADDIVGPRTLVIDDAENATVVDMTFNGLQARRLAKGATAFSAARTLGPTDGIPSGVALSPTAVAFAVATNSQVLVTVQTWP